MVIMFFFKQKTAYEMRISDWSSDVCSSDLFNGAILTQTGNDNQMSLVQDGSDNQALLTQNGDGNSMSAVQTGAGNRLAWTQNGNGLSSPTVYQEGNRDRKSVVEGKSVSVRVDLGGRGIIKKKKK